MLPFSAKTAKKSKGCKIPFRYPDDLNDVYLASLIHLTPLVSFYTHWKHHKIRGFLIWCFQWVYKETSGMKWVKIYLKMTRNLQEMSVGSNFSCDIFYDLQTRIKSSPLFQRRQKHYTTRCLFFIRYMWFLNMVNFCIVFGMLLCKIFKLNV